MVKHHSARRRLSGCKRGGILNNGTEIEHIQTPEGALIQNKPCSAEKQVGNFYFMKKRVRRGIDPAYKNKTAAAPSDAAVKAPRVKAEKDPTLFDVKKYKCWMTGATSNT